MRKRPGLMGKVIDQGTPDYTKRPPLKLREIEVGPGLRENFPPGMPIKAFTLGECSVIVTREMDRWHLSIAHRERYPTWSEIAEARYRILPDNIYMAMILPPKSKYVNICENCFQLIQVPATPRGI